MKNTLPASTIPKVVRAWPGSGSGAMRYAPLALGDPAHERRGQLGGRQPLSRVV
jgi:hypothetical protein